MTNPEAAAQSASPEDSLPERFQKPRLLTLEDAMPLEWIGGLATWLQSHRRQFVRGGDPEGRARFGYELLNVDEQYAPIRDLREQLTGRVLEQFFAVTGAEPFDPDHLECHATLYHNGGHLAWHRDTDGAPARRIAFALYLHGSPKMFTGGELEFVDGTAIEPVSNRLVMYEPDRRHRVRHVECWSADFLHGRWAVSGWLHGRDDNPSTSAGRYPADA